MSTIQDTNLVLRQTAFGTLGVPVGEAYTAAEVMEHAGLSGWNLRKSPAFTIDADTGKRVQMTDRFAVIRDVPGSGDDRATYVGDVGKNYRIVQNEEHIEFLDTLVDESGAHFSNAGTLWGGKGVFISMTLPGTMVIGGVDQVNMEVAALNSHDGATSFTLMTTPVRVACMNMLNMATKHDTNIYRVRHTQGLDKKGLVQQAREALDLSFKYLDSAQVEFEQMIQTTLTEARFNEIITKEFGPGKDASPHAVTRAEAKIGQLQHLFTTAATQENIRGTVWAGFNALTEWNDHYAASRGEDRGAARATAAITNPLFKERARALMMAAV